MQTTKLYEILSSYNRYWTTGDIDAGIKRDLLTLKLDKTKERTSVGH